VWCQKYDLPDLFATYYLSVIAGIEHKFVTMFKQSVMQKHEVQMQFVKVFLGPSGWGITVYLCGVHVQPAVMCMSPIQNCCYKTKKSKILLCCLTWHGHVFKNSRRHEACCSSDWYSMKLLYVPVAVCVHLFICRLWGTFYWDPLEMLLKLRHIKLQMLKLWSCIGAN
jgi:hypothetical protein